MVSHCANPECSAQFLYFAQGQVIAVQRNACATSKATVEFFWLCGNCAPHMNLEIMANGAMNLIPRAPISQQQHAS